MPCACRRGRPCTAWMDSIKMWTGLPVEESSEWQRTEINEESTSMVWPTLGSRTAKEHNRAGVHKAESLPVESRDGVDSFQRATRGDEVWALGAVALDVERTVGMSVFHDRDEAGPVTCQVVRRHPLATLHTDSFSTVKHRQHKHTFCTLSTCSQIPVQQTENQRRHNSWRECRLILSCFHEIANFWILMLFLTPDQQCQSTEGTQGTDRYQLSVTAVTATIAPRSKTCGTGVWSSHCFVTEE